MAPQAHGWPVHGSGLEKQDRFTVERFTVYRSTFGVLILSFWYNLLALYPEPNSNSVKPLRMLHQRRRFRQNLNSGGSVTSCVDFVFADQLPEGSAIFVGNLC